LQQELLKEFLFTTNRDNKTAIELFLVGVRGWEGGLRRRLNDRKATQD